MSPDGLARSVAQSNHGIITRRQLRSCGLSDKQIHVRKRRGDLVRLLPEVFIVAGAPQTYEARLTAVSLWMGESGFFHALTAAELLELDGVERSDRIAVAHPSGLHPPPWVRLRRVEADDDVPIRRFEAFA